MDSLNLYLLTFNCARTPADVDLFSKHFFHALPHTAGSQDLSVPPELIVLCLQEIAPISYSFIGGSFLAPYFDVLRQVVSQAVSKRWGDVHYADVVADNSGMTGLMVFARSDVTDRISRVDKARVGVGIQQMGNKGAVGARLGYQTDEDGETLDLTFVAAHLAPFEYAFEKRNGDWREIVQRLVFSRQARQSVDAGDESESAALLQDLPSGSSSENQGMFTPNSYLFFAGDLNYRTSNTLPLPGDHARFPTFDADPSSAVHHSQLFKDDQLNREKRKSRCFHGMSEAPINFPPTYKYSAKARRAAWDAARNNTEFQDWKWTATRWPSWCDRVLYLDTPTWMQDQARVQTHGYDALPLFPTSDHRAVALSASVPLRPIRVPDDVDPATDVRLRAPFPIDPEWERKRDVARGKEIIVGYLAYLGLTWEGNGLVLASIIGVVGAWLVLRSLLAI
ncbi:hypothetical protein ASPWEDRAFT_100321 [Aspergillus wentii DTO 134E9]|uniref:Inositol polyphosphate-related phosphatase domain-containing protein n=1 Tax=Aspergillus wentii DTO 134E9 TaxID=1073089 RepID=A0A1L9S2Z3_ASPWE|nr:uncharacterized protein ASPWEDRAFT_100321 [Aspergillus wentii DTO 134E9]KAI9929865.1 hypothetical protein MW887_011672 [Aspergillus wentii]OJJ41516.1 hypothetical protein ASPWEDRAFT_100321 [Aspergillus wentii DTO 134E9]